MEKGIIENDGYPLFTSEDNVQVMCSNFIRKSINANIVSRSKFGESFVRVVVFGMSKFPSGQLVLDTGVLLRPDEENFIHILDLWSSQVWNN